MTLPELPQRQPTAIVLTLGPDTPSDRLAGKACIRCGTRSGPLAYIGWARVSTTHPDRHLSCPVSACAPCRTQAGR